MDVSPDSEINGYSTESDKLDGHWSAIDAGISNMYSKPDNTSNHEKNAGDIQTLSDVCVSSADTYTPKSLQQTKYLMPIEITNWEPFLIDDKLVISGNVAGLMQTDRICKQRLSSLIFKDDDGVTCCILGPMKLQNDVPDLIRNQFKYIYRIGKNGEKFYKDGIPENWLKVCSIWKCYIDTVDKNMFDWPLQFKIFSLQPLIQSNNITCNKEKLINNGPKTKIKKKFEKYKNMFELEILRNARIADSESDTDVYIRKKAKLRNVINHQEINGLPRENNKNTVAIQTNYIENDAAGSSIILSEQTSLNKRTSWYIQNQIPNKYYQSAKISVASQTDLTQSEDSIIERNDKNQSTNVTVLSPTKPLFKPKITPKSVSENCTINDQLNKKSKNESNKKLIASNTILKELTNKEAACSNVESNDDTSPLEFYENIVANSTVIDAKTPAKQAICKTINYICSKTLEKFAKRTSSNFDASAVESLDVIDIDLFSQTILNSPVLKDNSSMKNLSASTLSSTKNLSASTLNESVKSVDSPDLKQLKTIKNNIEKTNTTITPSEEQKYNLRSPKRYITTKKTKGLKRKKGIEINDGRKAKRIALGAQHPENAHKLKSPELKRPLRVSLRNRIKHNYRELLFSRIALPENSIIKLNPKINKLHAIKKTKKQLKKDEKIFKKCFVMLMRENLELKTKRQNRDVISTSKFTVTDTNVEKENSTPVVDTNTTVECKTPANKPAEHVFKTPLTTIVKKKKNIMRARDIPKLNKTLNIPNFMPKVSKDQKKLSLPANPLEMWNIVKPKLKTDKFEAPPSPFSLLSDTSSDASDKRRRKLFSPDNWMQSDGCLKNLSQNEYQSSDSRFSIRFDDTDPNMDSEFSDSGLITSS